MKEIPTEITEEEDERELNEKQIIGLKLFDKDNPEMITKVSKADIDNISILSTITEDENRVRKELGFSDNLFNKVIHNNLVLRTSLEGWRAEQGVQIITAIIDEEKRDLEEGINTRLKRVIGRG